MTYRSCTMVLSDCSSFMRFTFFESTWHIILKAAQATVTHLQNPKGADVQFKVAHVNSSVLGVLF